MGQHRSPFAQTGTYDRLVGESPDAHAYVEGIDPFTVTFRVLNAGDRAVLRDKLALEFGEEEGSGVTARLGMLELVTVQRAVVRWNVSPAASPATIAKLQPNVLEELQKLTAFGEIPEHKTHAEQLAELEAAEAAEGQEAEEEPELAEELTAAERAGEEPVPH